MNLAKLEQKLFAVARAYPPSDRVPYAFEKRITALIGSRPQLDRWELWGRALWRAAAPCVVIALLLGAWSWFTPSPGLSGTDLSQQLEQTLLAASDQDSSTDTTW
jgi:hypothetical protein